jgi:hypothetical protein
LGIGLFSKILDRNYKNTYSKTGKDHSDSKPWKE